MSAARRPEPPLGLSKREILDLQEQEIKDAVLRMGALVEEAIRRAAHALVAHDTTLALDVVKSDTHINDAQRDVSRLISVAIATQAPVARDGGVVQGGQRVKIEIACDRSHQWNGCGNERRTEKGLFLGSAGDTLRMEVEDGDSVLAIPSEVVSRAWFADGTRHKAGAGAATGCLVGAAIGLLIAAPMAASDGSPISPAGAGRAPAPGAWCRPAFRARAGSADQPPRSRASAARAMPVSARASSPCGSRMAATGKPNLVR